MKLKVNQNKCIGCGLCATLSPKTFKLDRENYKAKVIKQPQAITEELKKTINNCPVAAIEKVEEKE